MRGAVAVSRFCHRRLPRLARFCSPGDKKQRGAITISNAELIEDGDGAFGDAHAFVFTLKIGRKSYHIQAASELEKRSWLSALSYNMAQCNPTSPSRHSLIRYERRGAFCFAAIRP